MAEQIRSTVGLLFNNLRANQPEIGSTALFKRSANRGDVLKAAEPVQKAAETFQRSHMVEALALEGRKRHASMFHAAAKNNRHEVFAGSKRKENYSLIIDALALEQPKMRAH